MCDYDRDVYHINSGRKTSGPMSTDQVILNMGVVKGMVQKWLRSQREKSRSKRVDEVKVEPKQAVANIMKIEKNRKDDEIIIEN